MVENHDTFINGKKPKYIHKWYKTLVHSIFIIGKINRCIRNRASLLQRSLFLERRKVPTKPHIVISTYPSPGLSERSGYWMGGDDPSWVHVTVLVAWPPVEAKSYLPNGGRLQCVISGGSALAWNHTIFASNVFNSSCVIGRSSHIYRTVEGLGT